MPKKILIVIAHLDIGGTERHVTQLIRKLHGKEFQFCVCTIDYGGALSEELKRIGVIVKEPCIANKIWWPQLLFKLRFPMLVSIVKLIYIFLRRDFDIVHFFLPRAYLIGGLLSILCIVPVKFMSRRSLNIYQKKYPVISKIEIFLHRFMTVVLGNSKAVINDLHHEGVAEEKLHLIYNGIDEKPFKQKINLRAERANLGIAASSVVFIMVANFYAYKGHSDIINGFASVAAEMPKGWALLLIGKDNGAQSSAMALSAKLGLVENIHFLGVRKDVPELLMSSDVGLLSSHQEGFSNSILEYLAAALPVIATDVGGNSEAVVDGENGFLCSPKCPRELGHAILTLARDKELRKRLGKSGKKRFQNRFTIDACAKRYADLYRNASVSYPDLD